MLELMMYLELPITLPEVLFLMAMSALVGLTVYGIIKLVGSARSDDEGMRNRRDRRRHRKTPPSSLDASGWTILVDGGNFAHGGDDAADVSLTYLQEVLDALVGRFSGAEVIVFCNAKLRHEFDEKDRRKFEKIVDNTERRRARGLPVFRETDGQKSEKLILNDARERERCIVVSNRMLRNGDAPRLRIGVPLMNVQQSERGVRLAKALRIFNNAENPEAKTTIPVGTYIRRRNG